VFELLLVALSLGLSNFAASVGIGTAGADAGTRLRLGAVFGLFETGMPILGLLAGHGLARDLGGAARWVGAGLLIATGAGTLIQGRRARTQPAGIGQPGGGAPGRGGWRGGRLLVTGLALSIDNLAVGFALGAYHVSLPLAVAVIGAVSVALSLLGLELGDRLGARAGERGEYLGGIVLIGTGAAVAAGVFS
jgi:manganese efflux pump family protein